jgi:hypothetical protein
MIINFSEHNVYETIWTGDVDRILSYDTERLTFLVEDVATGEKREHMTALDTRYITESPEKYSRINQLDLLQYLIDKRLPRYMISDRAYMLKKIKKNKGSKIA